MTQLDEGNIFSPKQIRRFVLRIFMQRSFKSPVFNTKQELIQGKPCSHPNHVRRCRSPN